MGMGQDGVPDVDESSERAGVDRPLLLSSGRLPQNLAMLVQVYHSFQPLIRFFLLAQACVESILRTQREMLSVASFSRRVKGKGRRRQPRQAPHVVNPGPFPWSDAALGAHKHPSRRRLSLRSAGSGGRGCGPARRVHQAQVRQARAQAGRHPPTICKPQLVRSGPAREVGAVGAAGREDAFAGLAARVDWGAVE